jgi:hypothetical protein
MPLLPLLSLLANAADDRVLDLHQEAAVREALAPRAVHRRGPARLGPERGRHHGCDDPRRVYQLGLSWLTAGL